MLIANPISTRLGYGWVCLICADMGTVSDVTCCFLIWYYTPNAQRLHFR